jgi:glyoxylase-like metal-dependent hydrolase (beta-lactamase superfamily II)
MRAAWALTVVLAAACARAADVTPDLQVRELRPGVWIHTSWQALDTGQRFPSNGLIVREGDHLLLVDTAWGEPATEKLLQWIESTLRLPVRAVIATHFHADRLGGAPALQRRGIPFYGHPLTPGLAATVKLPAPRTLGGLARAGGVDHVESLEVFYPGPAHTRDNVVVWLPGSRVLHGGCAVRAGDATALGNVADADVGAYAASIRRVLERYPQAEIVIPGHGDPGGVELLRNTITVAENAAR